MIYIKEITRLLNYYSYIGICNHTVSNKIKHSILEVEQWDEMCACVCKLFWYC